MSEGASSTAPPVRPAVAAEAAAGDPAEDQDGAANPREVRCSDCIVWNRQQTWLCVVPLLIGFIGLGLSLMLLKWIVVGSVKDYVPTDLMDSKGIGQDPIFLSKENKSNSIPKVPDTATSTTATITRTPNQISTRLTTTTRAPVRFPGARIPAKSSPRTTTVRHAVSPPTMISSTLPLVTTTVVASPPPETPTTKAVTTWHTVAHSTSSTTIYLHDATPSWTLSRFPDSSTTTPATTNFPKFHTTTYSTERSEHFKPCKDKDLAYCLNDGECFVIETLAGSNKHCRCKEGYQGVRCDQFLPKTDSILSDPKSADVYQRQVLSISCIVFGLVVVGVICSAFYFRTKKQTKKTQEQLKETRIGKNYCLHASSMLAKSDAMAQSRVQLQNYSKSLRQPGPVMEKMMESSFSGSSPFPESHLPDRGSHSIKHHSPAQRNLMLQRHAFRRTPPLPRGRLNGITGPAYQQLEEPALTDQDMVPCQGLSSAAVKTSQYVSINMQLPSRQTQSYCNKPDQPDLSGCRASSVPIIASEGSDDACMQMKDVSEVPHLRHCTNSYSVELVHASAPPGNCLIAEQQEVKVLLETVQEQIRILTDARRKSEDYELANVDTEDSASENTAFLPMSPLVKAPFVLRNESQRDLTLNK
ncbi:pro-neuregulin-3, membrane-bound isoform isoform X2 [Ambystoma mexicanum]|uniref:pro-neuregulin-3, membrane-bound isoform isoform X2 n=1 Tax=Ambystoma mexicanum TaxID=8296 RepID=UPI0037E8A885